MRRVTSAIGWGAVAFGALVLVNIPVNSALGAAVVIVSAWGGFVAARRP